MVLFNQTVAIIYFPFFPMCRNLQQLKLDSIIGVIMNMPSPIQLGFVSVPIRRKHWIAIRQIDSVYYNLDSKLNKPQAIGHTDAVRKYLQTQLKVKGCELLLVVEKEVADNRRWLREEMEVEDVETDLQDSATGAS